MAERKPHKRQADAPARGGSGRASSRSTRGRFAGQRATSRRGSSRAASATPRTVEPLRSTSSRREAQTQAKGNTVIRRAMIAIIIALAVALVGLVGVLVLSMTPAFTITDVEADATEHVSADNIVRLAALDQGATLLNVDESKLTSNLQKNPWVGEVHIKREFPSTLKITITERRVDALVVMNSGDVAWCLGDGNIWIEPIALTAQGSTSSNDVAVQKANELGTLLITGSPASVNPKAGSVATDASIEAVQSLRTQLSDDFASQITSFSASSASSVSCQLSSGVEVSFGSASNVDTKEAIVNQILQQYPNRVVYINVRVPSKPSYRLVNTEYVQAGSDDASDSSSSGSSSGDSSSSASSDGSSGSDNGQSSSASSNGDGSDSDSDSGNGSGDDSSSDGSSSSSDSSDGQASGSQSSDSGN